MTIEIAAPASVDPVPGRLRGCRILVTGAAGGLGRPLCLQAAGEGAELVLLDCNLKGLEALHDDIEEAGYPQPALYPLDLLGATPDDHAELANRLQQALGGLDAVVHAAAALGEPAPLSLYDPETWLRTLHANVSGAFLLIRACLPLLRPQAGRIVAVSDRCGRQGQAAMGAYGVSKWALEGLVQTLAAEHSAANPVIACSIDPGAMRTNLRRHAYAGEMAEESPPPEAAAAALLTLLDPAHPPANGGLYSVTH